MLLARPMQHGSQGRATLLARASAFQRGEWRQLLAAARSSGRPAAAPAELDAEVLAERRHLRACTKVRQGELSRARQVLTAAELAPGNVATWAALTDPVQRPPHARTEPPAELLQYEPMQPVQLSTRAVANALREARRGSAAGLSGMQAEHPKLLLHDLEALELLAEAATHLAHARIPPDIAAGLAMARLTALRKPDGGVRGIATGDALELRANVPVRYDLEWDHRKLAWRAELDLLGLALSARA
ncbi:unnamed protein product [Symbiodinium pilosum]|uniref:Uncharacterized protein n=1 Tax=Symbiodinium pilosum TaxID=2952 RepID=A0A812L3T9_SYMPI|nr:unnamed protein product [Symbiodinium pilosum]